MGKIISINKRKLIKCISGVIYEMAPFNKPRNFDKIIDHVINNYKTIFGEDYTRIDYKEINSKLKELLFNCIEFTQLNISQKKWDNGIRDYNDQNNKGIGFVAVGHDNEGIPVSITESKDYSDFIDLDACISNINYAIQCESNSEDDCFLCKYAKEYHSLNPSDCEICKKCRSNPNYDYNRENHPMSIIPRNSPEYQKFKQNGYK